MGDSNSDSDLTLLDGFVVALPLAGTSPELTRLTSTATARRVEQMFLLTLYFCTGGGYNAIGNGPVTRDLGSLLMTPLAT